MQGTIVVGSAKEFVAALSPGDLIVFDSMRFLSGLVQFADLAPVNHVGVMTDATTLAMANAPAGQGNAVARHSLQDIFDSAPIHGATALRHADLTPQHVARINEAVTAYEVPTVVFSKADLLKLGPAALLRSYGEAVQSLPAPAADVIARLWEGLARRVDHSIPDDATTLTCSEFVYRCLAQSELTVEIVNPLIRDADGAVSVRDTSAPEQRVYPELVTPGDLLRSPSFSPVVQLVVPETTMQPGIAALDDDFWALL